MMMISRDPALQLAVGADHGDDLAAVRAEHDGAVFAADLLGADVARAEAEAVHFVVTNERLAAGIANDDAAGFGEHRASALLGFLARATEIIEAARSSRGCSGRDRRQRLGARRQRRKRGGDGWRCMARERRSAAGR
jgi:hypothetical protein